MGSGRNDLEYRQAARALQAIAPPNSVCLCMQTSGSVFYDTGLAIVRSDQLDRDFAERFFRWAAVSRTPVYAALFDFEKKQVLSSTPAGSWRAVAESPPVSIWRWDP
jgi:hypothetical protein